MGLRNVQADLVLASAARTTSGNSGPIANPGVAAVVLVMVHCTAASGDTPTLDVSLEESADNSNWTAVANSGATQLTAAGNRVATARVSKNYVRVAYTIAGVADPSFTFSATVMVAPN